MSHTIPPILALSDFHAAFFIIAGVGAIATQLLLRLPKNAGHQLMGGPRMH